MKLKEKIASIIGMGNAFFLKYSLNKKFMPSSIRIDITATCNAKCPFCPREYMDNNRKKGFMSLEYYNSLLNQANAMGIRKIKLYITSEPTLHPDFDEMVLIAKSMGFSVFVSTNASQLHKHVDTFKNIDFIQFSIEGWNKQSYEKYRKPLKFDTIYRNMKEYCELSKDTNQIKSIHIPLTKETNLEEFLLLWGNMVDEIRVDFMQPANIYSNGIVKSEFNNLLSEEYYNFFPIKKNFSCFDPFEEITVGYDGKIMLCCLEFSGKVDLGSADDGLYAAHTSKEIREVRNQFYTQNLNICKNCSLFYHPSSDSVKAVSERIKKFKKFNKIEAEIIF